MLAVTSRAYAAALTLLDTIQRVANREIASPPPSPMSVPTSEQQASGISSTSDSSQQQRKAAAIAAMVYPAGSSSDDSPLHVVCCNDTCSFTWTGAEHINQVRSYFCFQDLVIQSSQDVINIVNHETFHTNRVSWKIDILNFK